MTTEWRNQAVSPSDAVAAVKRGRSQPHRVVRASGDLGGYAGGLDRKQRLLELEGARLFAGVC